MKAVYEVDLFDERSIKAVIRSLGALLEESEFAPIGVDVGAQPAVVVETPAPAPRKRRTKAEIEAAKAAAVEQPAGGNPEVVREATKPALEPEVAAPPALPSFLDDEPAEPAQKYTKADARAALVALQMKRTGQYEQQGKAAKDAVMQAQADTLKVLQAASGTEKLGGIDDNDHAKFGAIVEAANKEAAKSI